MQSSPPTDKNAVLRTMQVIAGALILGVLVMGAVAASLAIGAEAEAERSQLVASIAAGLSLLVLVVAAIVPANVSGALREEPGSPARELAFYTAYQTRMIVRLALVEGAAMLNLVAAIVDKQQYSLVLAGLLVLIMLAMFPTRGRVERFIKTQVELSELPHGEEGL